MKLVKARGKMHRVLTLFLLAGMGGVFRAPEARATILPALGSLAHDVLSETVPTAISQAPDLEAADYRLEWIGTPLPEVTFAIGQRSLQWVRVLDVLTLPRARLVLTAKNVEAGRIFHAGYSQALQVKEGSGEAEAPIALLSGDENPILVTVKRQGRESSGKLRVRFMPRQSPPEGRILFDPSCSRFQLETVRSRGAKPDEWAYIGCRLVYVQGAEHRTSDLEMYIYWDNVGRSIRIGDIATDETDLGLWPLRLSASPGSVSLQAGEHEVGLHYRVPENLHLANLGIGLGPYSLGFQSSTENYLGISPMLTLYASYFITEAFRVVAFDATTVGSHSSTDFGLYLRTENTKAIDRRFSLNILLGAHVIGFSYLGQYYAVFGAPQGIEANYIDAFKPGNNLSLGSFFYPPINGTSYYNLWLRWGGSTFVELNYIAWGVVIHDEQLQNASYGLTIGFPVASFF